MYVCTRNSSRGELAVESLRLIGDSPQQEAVAGEL